MLRLYPEGRKVKMEEKIITPGISDSEFIRGKVPMTKQEVRSASVCKLRLLEDSVVYDIGCGTGSVSIEIARLSKKIKVLALDSNPEAVSLTRQNARKFGLENIEVVEGEAPQALKNLPAATHAFIGGSGGHLKEIIAALKEKNSDVKVVMNAVSLESVAEIEEIIKSYTLKDYEVVQFFITKTQKIGSHHLFKAGNPVFIFSFEFGGGEQ